MIDLAAFNHALHAVVRPAALLPEAIDAMDPFAQAMRHIEFESGRLMQAQILFLKGPQLLAVRDAGCNLNSRRHPFPSSAFCPTRPQAIFAQIRSDGSFSKREKGFETEAQLSTRLITNGLW